MLSWLTLKIDRLSLHKKWSFPLRISSVNVTKSAVFCYLLHAVLNIAVPCNNNTKLPSNQTCNIGFGVAKRGVNIKNLFYMIADSLYFICVGFYFSWKTFLIMIKIDLRLQILKRRKLNLPPQNVAVTFSVPKSFLSGP